MSTKLPEVYHRTISFKNVGKLSLSSLCFVSFSIMELYPVLNVFLSCLLSLSCYAGPRLSVKYVNLDEIHKASRVPPRMHYTVFLGGGSLTFVSAFLVWFSFSVSCLASAPFDFFGYWEALLWFHISVVDDSLSFSISMLFSTGLMPEKLEDTSCRRVLGLHWCWSATITRTPISHVHSFACHTKSSSQLFYIYQPITCIRVLLLHLSLRTLLRIFDCTTWPAWMFASGRDCSSNACELWHSISYRQYSVYFLRCGDFVSTACWALRLMLSFSYRLWAPAEHKLRRLACDAAVLGYLRFTLSHIYAISCDWAPQ